MRTTSLLFASLIFILTTEFLYGQGGIPGNIRPPGGNPLGWTGGVAGPLDIRNDFAGQPIRFYTNGFLRMTILDGPATGGFVGINTATPNQRLTVRSGNINALSPAGNTGYMIGSNAFPSEYVLWHAGNRTNILVGVQAAGATGNTGGFRTTIVGFQAGQGSNFSDDCVFIGANAGANNQTDFNVFVGSGASSSNVGASANVSVGYQAGQTLNSNTPTQNVFVGFQAGQGNASARFNTMVGFRAGRFNAGEENTFIGNQAAMQCTNGTKNVAIGNNTGLELTTGIENLFAGAQAASNNATGSQNVVLGHNAAQNTVSIDMNVIIGEEAYAAPSAIGDANVVVGWRASDQMVIGANNVMIGHRVNPQTPAGDDNIFIGHLSGSNVAGRNNSIAIGVNARVRSSDNMILGDNTINVGIGLSDDVSQNGPQNKLEIDAGLNLTGIQPNGTPGASGLRFRDLHLGNTPSAPNGICLSVDANGDVIIVPAGGGLGTCAAPTTFGGANGAINLNNTDNFYFIGNNAGTGVNNVVIGKTCGPPLGKLDVLQASGSTIGSVGIYTFNKDLAGTLLGEEVIGIKSIIPFVPNPTSVGQIAIQGIVSGDKYNIAVDGLANSSGFNVFNTGGRFTAISGSAVINYGVEALAQDGLNNVGVTTTAVNGGSATGLSATGANSSSVNIGVKGYADGGTDSYGGYFTVGSNATNTNYAVYSDGDLFINGIGTGSMGQFYTSDIMFKTNIDTIPNASGIVSQLQPKQFYFDTTNAYNMRFSSNKQYGLIAQDVETVMPELVETRTKPAEYDSVGNIVYPSVTYKVLNYNAFFAILIKGMQEQQAQIDSLQTQVSNCCNANARTQNSGDNVTNVTLTNSESVVLNQNVPNPFAEQTTITYYLPESTVKAQMLFYDAQGRLIKAVDLEGRGNGQLNVFADDLSNGIYSYALVVDGQVADTKKMVKTE